MPYGGHRNCCMPHGTCRKSLAVFPCYGTGLFPLLLQRYYFFGIPAPFLRGLDCFPAISSAFSQRAVLVSRLGLETGLLLLEISLVFFVYDRSGSLEPLPYRIAVFLRHRPELLHSSWSFCKVLNASTTFLFSASFSAISQNLVLTSRFFLNRCPSNPCLCLTRS